MLHLKFWTPLVLAGLVGAYILLVYITPQIAPPLLTSQGITTRNPDSVVSLTNSVATVTDTFYDTFTLGGAPYIVPAGKRLLIVHLEGVPEKGAGAERIEIGYASGFVSNSVAVPPAYTKVMAYSFEEANVGEGHGDVWAMIPSGTYPTLLVWGDASIQATGVLLED